jgi:hypothetical protein
MQQKRDNAWERNAAADEFLFSANSLNAKQPAQGPAALHAGP